MSEDQVWREPFWHKVLNLFVLSTSLQIGLLFGSFILRPCIEVIFGWWVTLCYAVQMGG